nr:MAG TPA: hypothetical protein [Caudoviricetes sp.]
MALNLLGICSHFFHDFHYFFRYFFPFCTFSFSRLHIIIGV